MPKPQVKLRIPKGYGIFEVGDTVISPNRWHPRKDFYIYEVQEIEPQNGTFRGICIETSDGILPTELLKETICRICDFAPFETVLVDIPDGYRELNNRGLVIRNGDLYFKVDAKEFSPCGRSVGKIAGEYFKNGALIITKRSEEEEKNEILEIYKEENRLIDIEKEFGMKHLSLCAQGKYAFKGITLVPWYDWVLQKYERGFPVLLPLQKIKDYSK